MWTRNSRSLNGGRENQIDVPVNSKLQLFRPPYIKGRLFGQWGDQCAEVYQKLRRYNVKSSIRQKNLDPYTRRFHLPGLNIACNITALKTTKRASLSPCRSIAEHLFHKAHRGNSHSLPISGLNDHSIWMGSFPGNSKRDPANESGPQKRGGTSGQKICISSIAQRRRARYDDSYPV
jgi:hypothetical protein